MFKYCGDLITKTNIFWCYKYKEMDDNDFELLSLDMTIASCAIIQHVLNRSSRKRRRCNSREILMERRNHGHYTNLIAEMRLTDLEGFQNFHRMTPEMFDELLHLVGPSIQKHGTAINPITPGERLSLTLRYLASGDSMVSLGPYGYRIGKSTTSGIIRETTGVIWDKLKTSVFPTMSSSTWKNISSKFNSTWNFPNCLGAIDGKHVVVQAFANSNSSCYNYKNSHSIVLMAVADAEYKFIFVDIGASGRNNDSGIFRKSEFGKRIINKSPSLQIPNDTVLPGSTITSPFCFVGDEAFPLLTNIMRPYPGRRTTILSHEKNVFNYRLSRARRVVENTFGILSAKWRIYRKPIIASKITVVNIIKATICLHNWLRMKSGDSYQYFSREFVDHYSPNGELIMGEWRSDLNINGLLDIERMGSNNPASQAISKRYNFANYFTNLNTLSWQNQRLFTDC